MYVANRQRNTFSVGDMLQHLEWRSLEDRRRDARLVIMYKISHDKVAVSKSDRLSPPLRHSRNMHSRSYQVPLCRTQQRKASFFPRTTVDWNCLPQTAVLSDSVESFRTASTTSHPLIHSLLCIYFLIYFLLYFFSFFFLSSSFFASQFNDIIFKLLK